MPLALFDTQLLLAEVYLEGQQWAEAAPLFETLVVAMKSAKPTTVDRSGQRALVGAVRVWLATGSIGQAADAALTLIAISHDEDQPNSVLVELAKLVGQEVKKAGAPIVPAEQTTLATAPLADPIRDLQGRLIDALAPRTALTVPQLIYIGDACISLDRSDKTREVYQRLLATIDRDEAAKAIAGAAATGIRDRLVALLRSEGKLDAASKQVTALINEHPNALEPLMEKGHILQSLAERDPRRYDECIAHWTDLRVRLGRSKTRPPEYYDVIYNAAFCLVRQASLNKNKKASQAEQMLKSTLVLTPKLSGPDMVARYEALLNQAVSIRGEPASAAGVTGRR
jgi:tetratricopeptide (TPR) repeat protein